VAERLTLLNAAEQLLQRLDDIGNGQGAELNRSEIETIKRLHMTLAPAYEAVYGSVPLLNTSYPFGVWWPRAVEWVTDVKAFIEADETWQPTQRKEFPSSPKALSAPAITDRTRNVMVVHGRDVSIRDSMFNLLRSIGLNPIEWDAAVEETGEGSPYIGQVLDFAFNMAQAVVVLMTPDDEARLRTAFITSFDGPHETQFTPQARANVIFEAGMAMGRNPTGTIIVEVGQLRPFSDIAGRHVLHFDGTATARHRLARRLLSAGCAVDTSGADWLSVGDFQVAESKPYIPTVQVPTVDSSGNSGSIVEAPTQPPQKHPAEPPGEKASDPRSASPETAPERGSTSPRERTSATVSDTQDVAAPTSPEAPGQGAAERTDASLQIGQSTLEPFNDLLQRALDRVQELDVRVPLPQWAALASMANADGAWLSFIYHGPRGQVSPKSSTYSALHRSILQHFHLTEQSTNADVYRDSITVRHPPGMDTPIFRVQAGYDGDRGILLVQCRAEMPILHVGWIMWFLDTAARFATSGDGWDIVKATSDNNDNAMHALRFSLSNWPSGGFDLDGLIEAKQLSSRSPNGYRLTQDYATGPSQHVWPLILDFVGRVLMDAGYVDFESSLDGLSHPEVAAWRRKYDGPEFAGWDDQS
jgi:predicted nucleotide-binding protein